MNSGTLHKRRTHTAGALVLGTIFFALSGALLYAHTRVVMEVKSVSVPLVGKLTQLERREEILKEQIELSELQSEVQVGSLGEKLDVYVLPKEGSLDRLLAVFDLLSDSLSKQNLVSQMSEIQMGPVERVPDQKGVAVRPLVVRFSAHDDGVQQILLLTRLAGLLTVGDALSDDETRLLFQSTEEENPVGVVALEQFLSQDLLRYARDTKAYEDQLQKTFSSPTFPQVLQSITRSSLLRDARRLFEGDFGRSLEESRLWPLQFLTLEEAQLTRGTSEGWYVLTLKLYVWERV